MNGSIKMTYMKKNLIILTVFLACLSGFAKEGEAKSKFVFDDYWDKAMTPIAGENEFLKALLLNNQP